MDTVAYGGKAAAARAGEGSVGGGGEHAGQAGLAEAMPTIQHQRRPLTLVVPRVAHGAARQPHNPPLFLPSDQSTDDKSVGKIN